MKIPFSVQLKVIYFALTLGVGYLVIMFIPSFSGPAIVVFDTHKLINSQRKAASTVLTGENEVWMAANMHKSVSEKVSSVIRFHAQGAHVLSAKAFVLAEDAPDITDLVLTDLGLPTDVGGVELFNKSKFEEMALIKEKPKLESKDASELDNYSLLP